MLSGSNSNIASETTADEIKRRHLLVTGIVQGVGFRPHVYRLATKMHLAGYVTNDSRGVTIEIEGPAGRLDRFCRELLAAPPPLARVEHCSIESTEPVGEHEFRVAETVESPSATAMVSPDIAVCDDCLRELREPNNRRFEYPFINCTNCGPRFTIVERIPYDRPATSMQTFPMCHACSAEYDDPTDRRFQAQPIACAGCGPKVWLHDGDDNVPTTHPFQAIGEALRAGRIVAIRGLGGFHLAVDATNNAAVQRLRDKKRRDQKPFALMAKDLSTIHAVCTVSDHEAHLLSSKERPIVLLDQLPAGPVADSVAPGHARLGIMLPYTPLHHLLFDYCPPLLVMTSGNVTDEPIAIGNDEALSRLGPIADLFLLHDREIVQRCDDSIVSSHAGAPLLLRRSRGYVPSPIAIGHDLPRTILACGAELKNTVALARGHHVVLSQHLGDLDNPVALRQFEATIAHLCDILQYRPELIACDLHPAYHATRWAHRQPDLPVIGIQHHHAHLCSVMADNGRSAPTIGVILDGTGFGTDGTVWGGEILVGDFQNYERFAWLDPVPLLGGTAGIKEPWRMALSYLWSHCPDHPQVASIADQLAISSDQLTLLHKMHADGINSPLTSSCGRLFDAAAALLGVCFSNSYEAQAAMALESMAGNEPLPESHDRPTVPADSSGPVSLGWFIDRLLAEHDAGTSRPELARLAHMLIAETMIQPVLAASATTGISCVGLSGGVFQNRLLLEYMCRRLTCEGLHVLTHQQVPANDGGIALGQVVAAAAKYEFERR